MRILHLTDFHYRSDTKSQYDQNKVIEKLKEKLKKESPIDIIIFSGDLVQTGNLQDDFFKAKELLLDQISEATKVSADKVFLCAGNHDVFRGQELIPITQAISKFNSNDDIEKFISEQGGGSFKISLNNLNHFNKFQEDFYKPHNQSEDIISDLFTVHFRNIGGRSIGIVNINSAWRALDSKTDRGSLLFPISILKEAIEKVKQQEFKIAILHHPISDFKDWNAMEIENLIYNEFHILFSGHVHQKRQSLHICSDEGIFCCFSPATLSLEPYSSIGYSIVNVDLDNYDLEIQLRKYDLTEKIFYELDDVKNISIPVNSLKTAQNQFRKKLRAQYSEVLKTANDLFVASSEQTDKRGFLNLFTDPILKSKTQTQLAEQRSDSHRKPLDEITYSNKDNYVINGKDKSGKTSILFKIQLDLLSDFKGEKILPLYIDCKELRNSGKDLDIYSIISEFYGQNRKNSEEFADKYSLKLLLDNYDPSFDSINDALSQYLTKFENVTFVACVEETLSKSFDKYNFDGRKYSNLFIQEISKKEVRTLTYKWPNLTAEKRELILEKIFNVLKQLNIPANYWTVSLFIWVYEKNHEANIRNNFELIQYYIDDLLDKDKFLTQKKIKIEFEDFKSFLSNLSHFLVTKHHANAYSASYAELVAFTEDYILHNKRFVTTTEEIIDILLSKGIVRKNQHNRYTVRLTGVFEYFIAFYMKDNEDFRNDVIEDDHYYLSFGTELELCAGFNRKDEDYLVKIYDKTQNIFSELNKDYEGKSSDSILLEKVSQDIDDSIQLLARSVKGALSTDVQDKISTELIAVDNVQSEVSQKLFYDKIEKISEHLEKSLFILARVFRNSSIKKENLENEILDFILNSTCLLGFQLIDEIKADEKIKSDETREKLMVRLMSTFMPLIVQIFLFDALAQNNLERIIIHKIEELKPNSKENQFKLHLLYFTLLDLDLKAHKHYIDDAMDVLKMGVLKQATLIKLFSYLMFKTAPNTPMETLLKTKIQEQSVKLNPKVEKANIQKEISKITKNKNFNQEEKLN